MPYEPCDAVSHLSVRSLPTHGRSWVSRQAVAAAAAAAAAAGLEDGELPEEEEVLARRPTLSGWLLLSLEDEFGSVR